jgi:maleylpyruvate isomerase
MVPALELDSAVLTQSPAILEWLEETCPAPALLPAAPVDRAHVRAMAALIGCDIHPLNNLRVGKALRETFGADQPAIDAWAARWILPGFEALEALVARHGKGWCFGDAPTLADCYLIPQIYSARRFNVPLEAFPRLLAIDTLASQHPAFIAAHPDAQPDAD